MYVYAHEKNKVWGEQRMHNCKKAENEVVLV